MANLRKLQMSFAGGEVSPEMLGRLDDVKNQSGLARCRNFIVKPQGPVENRAGFEFIREVKDSTKHTRLIPFTYSTTQTMVIEMGAGYFRFHTQGTTLLEDEADDSEDESDDEDNEQSDVEDDELEPYEIENPYADTDLFDVHYVQSADVLTLTHPNYPPKELRRLGQHYWQLSDIAFTPKISAPLNVTATPNDSKADDKTYPYQYVVTSIAKDGKTESLASAVANCTGNFFIPGRWNTVKWAPVPGAQSYAVYRLQGGVYGYIGQTSEDSIMDDNIDSDSSITPPIYEQVFASAKNYPAAVSYFEQRRCFAGTLNQPQYLWMTKSCTESAMTYSVPVRDDDRVAFLIAAREANTIRHIVPLTQLLLLTNSAEWCVTSMNSDAITPSTVSVRPQSYVGASNVQPVIINNTLIYGAARGGHVRELAYSWHANGFVTGDLSLRSAHLFDGFDIVDMAYAKAPQPIVWFVSDNGKLLGLTYVPEQQIGAWHWHDTDGAFESCTVVAEGKEDVLYCVVRRTIQGRGVRYIERMASRQISSQEDAFFVDCGLTYSGVPKNHFGGLQHLEGKIVSILGDGATFPQQTVVNGAVTLEHDASTVHVGLPIEADLQTLPMSAQIDYGYAQGRVKNVNKVWLRVFESSGIFVGPHEHALTEAKQRTTEPYGLPPKLKSQEIPITLSPSWANDGQIFVRQCDPLPLTVINMTAEIAIGA